MNRKELATAISADMGGGVQGSATEVKYIERVLGSMTDVITSAMKNKEPVSIYRLCSFRPFTGKARKFCSVHGEMVIPETERVQVRWSRKFMKKIQETS